MLATFLRLSFLARLHGLFFAVVNYDALRVAAKLSFVEQTGLARAYVSKLQKAQRAAEKALNMSASSALLARRVAVEITSLLVSDTRHTAPSDFERVCMPWRASFAAPDRLQEAILLASI